MVTPRTQGLACGSACTGEGAAISLFLFPLLGGGYQSVKGQPGRGQATGYGFGKSVSESGLFTNPALLGAIALSVVLLLGGQVIAEYERLERPGATIAPTPMHTD